MRKALVGTMVAMAVGVPAAAAQPAHPSRQPCTIDLAPTAISDTVATGSTGDKWLTVDLAGTTACNAQPPQPATATLYLTLTGCAHATGWGVMHFNIDTSIEDVTLQDVEWVPGAAHLYFTNPWSYAAVYAPPNVDLTHGSCFDGFAMEGEMLYNAFAGTPWGA